MHPIVSEASMIAAVELLLGFFTLAAAFVGYLLSARA